jgi:thiol:disulfide interchange protein
MNMKLIHFLLVVAGLLTAYTSTAQFDETHTKWSIATKKISPDEYDIIVTAEIEKDWHIYAVYLKQDDGPPATTIIFESTDAKKYTLVGKLKESKPQLHYEEVFGFDVGYHENKAQFTQRVRLLTSDEVTLNASYDFLVCMSNGTCIPPRGLVPLQVKLKGEPQKSVTVITVENVDSTVEEISDSVIVSDASTKHDAFLNAKDDTSIVGKDWWVIFSIGFGLGFLALFTPCVFPLIPMNVSFFLKRSESKGKGRSDALIFVFSIVTIFIALGLLVSSLVDERALHAFSTSAVFNGVIFVLLLIFAASFLGAFEITLPTGLVNKIDKQSDRGGYVGIFFMALTLVVVSFSCTGPIVATALSAAASLGNVSGAFWILFGFSSGLALPFGFFAFFPSLLGNIPQSGGWLNTVKVVLGFLELALAFKFASNVDLVYQAGILTREVFLVLWIAIFGLITIYLLGGFKTSHDSDVHHLSVIRLFIIIFTFSFTTYLIPGLWGAPLKLLSGVLPPYEYSESPQGFGGGTTPSGEAGEEDKLHVNKNGIVHFTNDYEAALAYAKKEGKPLMIDFTGRACANCRKVEDNIWPDSEVKNRLNKNVVLVSLYVDEKQKLPESERKTVQWNGRDFNITTIGDKNIYMQKSRYEKIAQPWYVLVDTDEQLLSTPRGYTSQISEYLDWLDKGIEEFKTRK